MTTQRTAPTVSVVTTFRAARPAFTLVEILIVVIILGILAAIVIPQFANASEDARRTNMRTQLSSLNGYSELYRLQHRDQAPDIMGANWDALVYCTAENHVVKATNPRNVPDATYKFGPYMSGIPVNPLTNSSVVATYGATAAPTTGWYYDPSTGQFYGANHSGDLSDTGE